MLATVKLEYWDFGFKVDAIKYADPTATLGYQVFKGSCKALQSINCRTVFESSKSCGKKI